MQKKEAHIDKKMYRRKEKKSAHYYVRIKQKVAGTAKDRGRCPLGQLSIRSSCENNKTRDPVEIEVHDMM